MSGVAESHEDATKGTTPTPMQEINLALKECGFGWFHIRLLVTCLFASTSAIIVSNASPYILPNAECDLNMNLLQKGILNATPYVGMSMSCALAGFLTDTFGRKIFLVGGYAGIYIFTTVASFSQTYEMLAVSNLFVGLSYGAVHGPTLTYTAEYCHSDVRDRVLLFQGSLQSLASLILAAMSWAILMQDWETSLFGGSIVLHTWNYYLLIISLFALAACSLYCLQPESPKFLVTQNRFEEARKILKKVYKMNTRKPIETFSVNFI